MKTIVQYKVAIAQYNVASLDAKQPSEKADYSAQKTKSALVRNPLAIFNVANIYAYNQRYTLYIVGTTQYYLFYNSTNFEILLKIF